MKNLPKVMEYCDIVMEFCQFCLQIVLNILVLTQKLRGDLQKITNSKLEVEMVTEKQEMVMDKYFGNEIAGAPQRHLSIVISN